MNEVREYTRDGPANITETPMKGDQDFLNDPFLQPLEGGYLKCTLCSATLPGQHHVKMHIQGKLHTRRTGHLSQVSGDSGYLEQYMRQFFEGELELGFGVVERDHAPAHCADEMICELCEITLYGWDQWRYHFSSKRHFKAQRNCPFRLFWQRLDADFPYYYEHISGLWQSHPPKQGDHVKNGRRVIVSAHPDHNTS
jgi:hypothetical protein